MSERPIAVDLFCGGGGFSEGLRQAGFDITHAVDIESRACDTYRLNHPEAEVIEADVMDLEPEDLPKGVDLLFGSPPCTEFSWAKQGGGGDIEKGMRLVKRFLYFVAELEPEYWIMENVPRLDNYLPDVIDFADVPWTDRTDSIDITKVVLDGDDYGTPQRRSRLFSGIFPVPEPTGQHALTFSEVQAAFPQPTDGVPVGEFIADPLYEVEVPAEELTDHFYDSHVTNREAEEIRVRKEDHSFYGRMQFPDDPDDASRTVLATNRRVARETLVMAEENAPEGSSRYRKPTIREIATIQGFPITYQYTGTSQAQKWRRVGDAVPPTVAFQLGCALRDEMGLSVPDRPDIRTDTPHPEVDLKERNMSSKGRRKLSISRSFRHHVPVDSKQHFRVDIETDKESKPVHPLADQIDGDEELTHPVEYGVVLYRGYSKDVESTEVDFETVIRWIDIAIEQHPELRSQIQSVVEGFVTELGPRVPDATTLQAIRSRRHERDEPLEYELLSTISDYDGSGIVDRTISLEEGAEAEPVEILELFDGTNLPVRVLLKLLGATYLVEKLNHCGMWVRQNPDAAHLADGVSMDELDSNTANCRRERCVDEHLTDSVPSHGRVPVTEVTETD